MTLGIIGSNGRLAQELIKLASLEEITFKLSSSKTSPDSIFLDLSKKIEFKDLDFIFSNVDCIVFLASISGDKTDYLKKNSKIYQVNVENLSVVAKWARIHGKYLIFTSGAIVYKNIHSNNILEFSEIGVNNYGGIYGESKYLGELTVEKEIIKGLTACLIRPSSIYGGNNSKIGMIETFILSAIRNNQIEIHPPFEQIIGFIHAYDVASSLLFAYKNKIKGAFNVSQSENISVLKICQIISRITNCGLILREDYLNNTVTNLDRYKLSNDKIKKLGWSDFYDIESGIMQCIKSLN